MARPRSEDKRQTLLKAATQLFAEYGLDASTARIANLAGVAEGTLFTYFASKDELLNQLYLELKSQLHAASVSSVVKGTLRMKVWHAWQAYVTWGNANFNAHQVLAKLTLSPRITLATRTQVQELFCDIAELLTQAKAQGGLRHQSTDFIGMLMGSMADATMDFMRNHPTKDQRICKDGFLAFWNAISS